MTNKNKPIKIKRRSGWSSCLMTIGWLCVILGGIGLSISISSRGNSSEVISLLITVLVGIQSFFLAFAIDVITDIRWFLKEINSKLNATNENQ
jgi:hypothetical protein